MKKPPLIWLNTLVLTLTPLSAAVFVPLYGWRVGFDAFEWSMFFVFMMFTGLSITGGYHRLWSHKAYKAHWSIRLFFAFWGACSLQNSVLKWSSDHRRHHRFVDNNGKDPYSAGRGFWFSHIGWVLRDHPSSRGDLSNVKDLERDPILVFQHRYYLHIAVFSNVVVPLFLGFLHGKLWGVFLLATLVRVVLNHHFTFFINSLAHMWGFRPYSRENSARDNGFLALLTYGEGYHNFHHRFQHDYRNGIKWWHFDPSKWIIKGFSWIGLTSNLKQSTKLQIERARLKVQFQLALESLEGKQASQDFKSLVENRYHQCLTALNDWAAFKQQWVRSKKIALREKMEHLEWRTRRLELKWSLKLQRRRWQLLLAQVS